MDIDMQMEDSRSPRAKEFKELQLQVLPILTKDNVNIIDADHTGDRDTFIEYEFKIPEAPAQIPDKDEGAYVPLNTYSPRADNIATTYVLTPGLKSEKRILARNLVTVTDVSEIEAPLTLADVNPSELQETILPCINIKLKNMREIIRLCQIQSQLLLQKWYENKNIIINIRHKYPDIAGDNNAVVLPKISPIILQKITNVITDMTAVDQCRAFLMRKQIIMEKYITDLYQIKDTYHILQKKSAASSFTQGFRPIDPLTPYRLQKLSIFDSTSEPTAKELSNVLEILKAIGKYSSECLNDGEEPKLTHRSLKNTLMRQINFRRRVELNEYSGAVPADIFKYVLDHWFQQGKHKLVDKYITDIKGYTNQHTNTDPIKVNQLSKSLSDFVGLCTRITNNVKILFRGMTNIISYYTIYLHTIITA